MSLIIGLTGGIASGKSAAAATFSDLGVPVIDADEVARQVVIPGSPGLTDVVAHFGPEILGPDGSLDRASMRRRVFDNPSARSELEALLHPLIKEVLLDWCQAEHRPYGVMMVPMLVRMGWGDLIDRLLLIDCPEALQYERLRSRDGIDLALAKKMINAQESRTERLEAADDIVLNVTDTTTLSKQIGICHQAYCRLAEQPELPLAPLHLPED